MKLTSLVTKYLKCIKKKIRIKHVFIKLEHASIGCRENYLNM